jgi:hypothetical protein
VVRDRIIDAAASLDQKLPDRSPDAKLQRTRGPSSVRPRKLYIESVAQGFNPQEPASDSWCFAVPIRHCAIYRQQIICYVEIILNVNPLVIF